MITRKTSNAQRCSVGGVLSVIQPHLTNRGTIGTAVTEMTRARTALSMHTAVDFEAQVAILQAALNPRGTA